MSASRGSPRAPFRGRARKRWRIWLLFALLSPGGRSSVSGGRLLHLSPSVRPELPVVDTFTWRLLLRHGWRAHPGVRRSPARSSTGGTAQVGAAGAAPARRCIVEPLDHGDRYHHRLPTSSRRCASPRERRASTCFVVPTLGLNAFAFSDLRGGGVIGVTEGALARLSRQQLQARGGARVRAYPVRHLRHGHRQLPAVRHLLLSRLTELEAAALARRHAAAPTGRRSPPWRCAAGCGCCKWRPRCQRRAEPRARAAGRPRGGALHARPAEPRRGAARHRRHPGGAGYIPEGLAPLCIRAAETLAPAPVRRPARRAPAPRRARRCPAGAGQRVARRVRASGRRRRDVFERREHWAAPPGSAASAAGAAASAGVAAAAGLSVATAPRLRRQRRSAGPRRCLGLPELRRRPGAGRLRGPRRVRLRTCGGRLSTRDVGKVLARREVGVHGGAGAPRRPAPTGRRPAAPRRPAGRRPHRRGPLPCPRCGGTMLRRHYSYEYAVEVDSAASATSSGSRRTSSRRCRSLPERDRLASVSHGSRYRRRDDSSRPSARLFTRRRPPRWPAARAHPSRPMTHDASGHDAARSSPIDGRYRVLRASAAAAWPTCTWPRTRRCGRMSP